MIGKKIRKRREELNMSQEKLARMIGVGKSAVSSYEKNITSPKEKVFLRLLDALECDANYFYEDFLDADKLDRMLRETEKELIKKYRELDVYGKRMIHAILEIEYERAITQNEPAEHANPNMKNA